MEEIKIIDIGLEPVVDAATVFYGVTPEGLDVTHTAEQIARAAGVSNQFNQNNITFTNVNGDYFGTVTAPRSGTLTFDITGAVTGGIAVVYYNDATLTLPETLFLKGTFAPGELNKIYLERDSQGFITANIVNGSAVVPGVASATAPTITVTDPVFDPDAPAATAPTITVTNP
jgi:hypothetical protein